LLKTLLVAGLSVTPRAMASTPPSFGLVKLVYGEGSRGLHPIASDQFRHFTLNSALTLTSLAVSLDNHFVELDLSHLKSLSVLSLHLPPTPSPSVNVSEELDVILSAIDTCGPSLQFLKISGSTRTYDTDLLEERNILNWLPPRLILLSIGTLAGVSPSYLSAFFSLRYRLPLLKWFECSLGARSATAAHDMERLEASLKKERSLWLTWTWGSWVTLEITRGIERWGTGEAEAEDEVLGE
jgi:hypothetical protein